MSCIDSCLTRHVPTKNSPLYRVHLTTFVGLVPLVLFLRYPRESLSTQLGGAMLAFQLATMWIFRGCIHKKFFLMRGVELVFLAFQIFVLGLVVAGSDTEVEDVVAPGVYSGFSIFVYYLSLWPFLRNREGLPLSGFLVKLFRYIMYEHALGGAAQITGLLATSRAWSSESSSIHVTIRALLVTQLVLGLAWWLLGYSSAFVKDLSDALDDTLYDRLAAASRRYGVGMLVLFVVELIFQIFVISYCLSVWPRGTLTTVGWWCLFSSAVVFIVTLAGLLLSTTTNRIWLDDIQQFTQDIQVSSSSGIDFGFRGVIEAHPGSIILTPALAFAVLMTLPFFAILGLLRNPDIASEDCDPMSRFLFTGLALGFAAIILSAGTLVTEMAFKRRAGFMFSLDLGFLGATLLLAVFTVIFSGSLPECTRNTLERELVRAVIAWSAVGYVALVLGASLVFTHLAGSIELEGDLWALWGFRAAYYESHRASLAGRRCFTGLKVWLAVMVPTLVVELVVVTLSGVGRVTSEKDSPLHDAFPQIDGRESGVSNIGAIRAFTAMSFFLSLAAVVVQVVITAVTRLRGPVLRPKQWGQYRVFKAFAATVRAREESESKVEEGNAEEAVNVLAPPTMGTGDLPSPSGEMPEAPTGDEEDPPSSQGAVDALEDSETATEPAAHAAGDPEVPTQDASPGSLSRQASAPSDATSISDARASDAPNPPLSSTAPPPALALDTPEGNAVAADVPRAPNAWLFEDMRISSAILTFLSAVVYVAIALTLFVDGEPQHQAVSVFMFLLALARFYGAVALYREGQNTMERKITFEEAHQAAIEAILTTRRSRDSAPLQTQASADDEWGIADVGEEIERQRQLSAEQRQKLWKERANHPEARQKVWVRRLDRNGAVVWVEAGTNPDQPEEAEAPEPPKSPRPDLAKKGAEAGTSFHEVEMAQVEPRASQTAPSTPMLPRIRTGSGGEFDVEAPPPLRRTATDSDLLSAQRGAPFSQSLRDISGGLATAGRQGMMGFMHGFADVFMDEDDEDNDTDGTADSSSEGGDPREPPKPLGLDGQQWLRQLNPDGSVTWVDGATFAEDDKDLSAFANEISSYDLAAAAVLPLAAKLEFFSSQVQRMRVPLDNNAVPMTLRRDNLMATAKDAFLAVPPEDFRKVFRITMEGEEGVDVGGLLRDFFAACANELVNESQIFSFSATDNISYQLNRFATIPTREDAKTVSKANADAEEPYPDLEDFRFLGRFLGKALMDEVPVDLHLIRPLYKHMLGLPLRFSDLEFSDRSTFESLHWILDNDGVEYLSLDYTVTETNPATGTIVELELCPGGRNKAVTDENKRDYVRVMFEHKMLHSISAPLNEFLRGLYEVIPMGLLSIFDFQELELAIAGLPDIDVADWRAHTIFEGELRQTHPVSRWFFEILLHFDQEQRARLLQFVTGTSRVPVGGFKNLQGDRGLKKAFELRSIEGGDAAWPRSHTCFNRLDLPVYSSRRKLREVLTRIILLEASDAFTIS